MKLSVIIVSYNTRFFIDLCLASVYKSMLHLKGEVIVVDNHSTDDSCTIIKQKYPEVKLIENKQNTGFGKANNQGIKIAQGEYVLLLNPDTLVPEDCLTKCVEYLDSNPEKGALGVKMVDGSGRYLPESKRGLPTPQTAFYKMSGLYRLFPRSATFSRYYHGNIAENETHDVDILTGAFFMARKPIGDQLGWFDEAYFMYGEDIDLSHSFTQAGHPIVYFPETSIVHFKGESSKDVDQKYIESFFGAMQIFYTKHFDKQYSRILRYLVLGGIWCKAVLVRFAQFFNQLKSQKQRDKNRTFMVWGTSDITLKVCTQLLPVKASFVRNAEELAQKVTACNGTCSIVFTSETSLSEQLKWMQKLTGNYPKLEYFFLSPSGDFLLGSNSRKLNGIVYSHSKT